jgi:uncharacterized membrane protein YjjP (DUF1212 family)
MDMEAMIIETVLLAALISFVAGILVVILERRYGEDHIASRVAGQLFITGLLTIIGLIIYWLTT